MDEAVGVLQKVREATQILHELGIPVNLLVLLFVWATMQFLVKPIDRAWWKAVNGDRKRGKRPKDNGMLVPVYPLIAWALGVPWALLLWRWGALVPLAGAGAGAVVVEGAVSGLAITALFKVYTTARNYQRLATGVRDGTIKVDPGSER